MRRALILFVVAILPWNVAEAQYSYPASVKLNTTGLLDQYLVVDPNELQGHNAYTLEAWVYPLSYSNFPTIIGNDYLQSFWLGLTSTGTIRFYPTGGLFNYAEGGTVPLGQWSHVAVTYDHVLGWAIYLNGVLQNAGATITGSPGVNPDSLFIGADRQAGVPDLFWRGYIDEVRIWSERRSAAQIVDHMFIDVGNPSFQSPEYADIQGAWDMQNSAVQAAFDRAGGLGKAQQMAYFRNGAATDPFAAPVSPNTGVEFDGTNGYAIVPMADGFGDGITVEAWVAPRSYSTFPTIAGREYQSGWWFGLNTSGRLRFYHAGLSQFVDGVGTVFLNRWTHVAVTYRNGLTTFYINGEVDRFSTALQGPIAENGKDVYVGADNGPVGSAFPWDGYLDEVRVTRGRKSAVQIRDQMYVGFGTFVNPFNTAVETGTAAMHRASFGGIGFLEVFGTNSRLVKSGAPIGAVAWTTSSAQVGRFRNSIVGGLDLPNGDMSTVVTSNFPVTQNHVISDTDVWVSAPTTNLEDVSISVESPGGITVELMGTGDANGGRDIHTVFDDASSNQLASGIPPYVLGVKPAEPLANFNGLSTVGTWEITISAAPTLTTLDIWAWGIRFNGLTVSTGDVTLPARASLRLAGGHPVHGTGGFTMELPRSASVDLSLVDVQGRHVRTLYSGAHPPGRTQIGWSTRGIGSGVYFALLKVDGVLEARLRVVVVR